MFKTEIVKARTFGEIAKINEELAKKKNAMQETLAANEEANKILAELYETDKENQTLKEQIKKNKMHEARYDKQIDRATADLTTRKRKATF